MSYMIKMLSIKWIEGEWLIINTVFSELNI